ncbi:hypothetical protein GCM10029964_036080 [Kibdelosporangium lantanae]
MAHHVVHLLRHAEPLVGDPFPDRLRAGRWAASRLVRTSTPIENGTRTHAVAGMNPHSPGSDAEFTNTWLTITANDTAVAVTALVNGTCLATVYTATV